MDLTDRRFETERLHVRAARSADAKPLAALMTAEISRWVAAWPHPLTETAAEGLIASAQARAAEGLCYPAVAVEAASGAVVGWLKIDAIETAVETSDAGAVELGYWIGEAFQRSGFGFELAAGALRFAFEEISAPAVVAGAQIANEGSHALLSRLGMSPDGERDVWAPSRARWERCAFWRIERRVEAAIR